MKRFFCAVLIALCLFGTVCASAGTKDINYKDHDFSITVGDDVLVMDSETGKYDPVWIEAGIEDPEENLDMMKQMNILSMLFDKKSGATVNIICKMTEDTVKYFSFENKSNEEILTAVDALVAGIDEPDENGQSTGVTYERSIVEHAGIPFFRLFIDIKNDEMTAKEVIYGTIVNGRIIEIDQYLNTEGEVDETFIKSVTDSVNITRYMTREDYDELIAKGKRTIWLFIGAIVLVIVGIFVFVTVNRKKKEKRAERISENIRTFRDRKTRGEVDCKTVISMGRATYSIKAIEKYATYNSWIRNAPVEVVLFAFLIAIVAFCLSTDSVIYGLLIAACGLVSIYFNYTGGEKNKANMIARHDAKNSPVAKFVFYEEFFTMTGAGAITDYTYDQVISVRTFNEYLYIFFGTEQGVFIERESIGEEELIKLIDHIRSHMIK